MRVPILVVCLSACVAGSNPPATSGDAGGSTGDSGSAGGCPLDSQTADQTFNTPTAEECNVPGSQGAKHWYRAFGQLPGDMEYIQVELWDGQGVFTGTTAAAGTYTISGSDAVYATCGVCVRGLGAKGEAGQKEYFATAGTVDVTAVSTTQLSASLSNIVLGEVDANHDAVSGGCTAQLASVEISGPVTVAGGGGGGGAGGGGNCPTTVGD